MIAVRTTSGGEGELAYSNTFWLACYRFYILVIESKYTCIFMTSQSQKFDFIEFGTKKNPKMKFTKAMKKKER